MDQEFGFEDFVVELFGLDIVFEDDFVCEVELVDFLF